MRYSVRTKPSKISFFDMTADICPGMSDPNSQVEVPPSKPPRTSQTGPTSTAQSQLEADEMYARQLAEHYGASSSSRGAPSRDHDPRLSRSRQETGLKPNELYDDREHSFFDGTYFLGDDISE